jgi:hypothetical protein
MISIGFSILLYELASVGSVAHVLTPELKRLLGAVPFSLSLSLHCLITEHNRKVYTPHYHHPTLSFTP